MKTTLRTCIYLYSAITLLAMQSCKKEAGQSGKLLDTSTENALTAKGVKQLILQPGPQNGYDTWLTWKANDSIITNWNWDTVAITAAYAWTSGGIPITGRSLIKFKGLSAIPSNALIISARLYMYGVENSIHLPAGNSLYPGSPYGDYQVK